MGDCAYRRQVSRDRRGTSLRPLDLLARGVRQVWRVGSRTCGGTGPGGDDLLGSAVDVR
jgi:hypothetical protein